jgi:hypothetical protein
VPPRIARTKESIDPQISVTVKEIDPQSSQYSCEVTVANVADEDFTVLEVDPRLTKGVSLNESIDSAGVALTEEHKAYCRRTGSLLTSAVLLTDQDMAAHVANQFRDNFRQSIKVKNIFELYYYLAFFRRYPDWVRSLREKSFKIDIRCADDARSALRRFPLPENSADRRLIEYNVDRLIDIEKKEDFDCARCGEILLKKGQQHKSIYVVSAKRGRLSPNTYSISFDIKMKRDDYSLARVTHATFTVPTGHLWTSAIAMAFAVVGALVQTLDPDSNAGQTDKSTDGLKVAISHLDLSGIVAGISLPILTALVVYNIFDMTSLKDKIGANRNWRTAVFVGFLCGFLNEKILHALSALLR